jgi:hypothetical protein
MRPHTLMPTVTKCNSTRLSYAYSGGRDGYIMSCIVYDAVRTSAFGATGIFGAVAAAAASLVVPVKWCTNSPPRLACLFAVQEVAKFDTVE